MSRSLTVLLATDVFPPRCGGSGWSTYHLARALRARGHRVLVARPQPALSRGQTRVTEYDGLPVHELALPGTRLPLARGVLRQEWFWPRFARFLADLARREGGDVLHGQHLLSVPAAARAGRALGLPVVATVRDYWPTCPLGTRLRRCPELPHCSPACQRCCLARGQRLLEPAVRVTLPYVRANLARRQAALRAASRVLAVSTHVAAVLRDSIPGLRPVVLPNFIDLADFPPVEARRDPATVLYVGKLDEHKGADLLPEAVAAAPGARLIVAGDGPLASVVAGGCAARGVPVELLGEVPGAEVARLMRQASVLLFPARWEEPLSRTLLEAGAAQLPAVALAAGGTPDIIRDGETGVLVERAEALGPALAALLADPDRRTRLGRAARRHVARTFSLEVVLPRVEALYWEVLAAR